MMRQLRNERRSKLLLSMLQISICEEGEERTPTESKPARYSREYCSMDPWPADSTKRSRLKKYGFFGFSFMVSFHST